MARCGRLSGVLAGLPLSPYKRAPLAPAGAEMTVRFFAILCLLALPGLAGLAQTSAAAPPETLPPVPDQSAPQAMPPANAPAPAPQSNDQQPPGRVLCEQHVAYHLAEPGTVPEQYRRYLGVWSDAAWDIKTCAALIVEDVKPDGTASIIYVYGPLGSRSTVTGAVLHGTGIVRDGALRFQNSDGSQYAFRPGIVDLTGHWINPQGESFQAAFKQTP